MTDNLTHGTYSTYHSGCRAGPGGSICEPCREAGRRWREEGTMEAFLAGKARKQPLFMPEDRTQPYDPDDSRHGTVSAYSQGCRCPWCTQAGVDYRASRKVGVRLPREYNSRHAD